MTDQEKLEILQIKLDEARVSMGLPMEALGDGTLIKLLLGLMTNPQALEFIRFIIALFSTPATPSNP